MKQVNPKSNKEIAMEWDEISETRFNQINIYFWTFYDVIELF